MIGSQMIIEGDYGTAVLGFYETEDQVGIRHAGSVFRFVVKGKDLLQAGCQIQVMCGALKIADERDTFEITPADGGAGEIYRFCKNVGLQAEDLFI